MREDAWRGQWSGAAVQLCGHGVGDRREASDTGGAPDSGRGACGAGAGAVADVRGARAAVDPAGAPAEGAAAAGAVHGAFGASADGAARPRPAVPVVRWAGCGRAGVGPLDVLEEPRPDARRGAGRAAVRGGEEAGRGASAAVARPFQRGRDADRGVRVAEVVPAEGRGGARRVRLLQSSSHPRRALFLNAAVRLKPG